MYANDIWALLPIPLVQYCCNIPLNHYSFIHDGFTFNYNTFLLLFYIIIVYCFVVGAAILVCVLVEGHC